MIFFVSCTEFYNEVAIVKPVDNDHPREWEQVAAYTVAII